MRTCNSITETTQYLHMKWTEKIIFLLNTVFTVYNLQQYNVTEQVIYMVKTLTTLNLRTNTDCKDDHDNESSHYFLQMLTV